MTDLAIHAENVVKDFILPQERITSIKGFLISLANGINRHKNIQHALRGVSFDVKQGEFFGIVGRNGSGKSTLLKILAGIYQPNSGIIHRRGKLVPFIELGVGFNPELTGRENVYLNGAMLGFSRKQIDTMFDDIVSFAELERFIDQKLKNYSSGMQVRLAFSMAVRSDADILLIDEVLAVGDADFQRKCFDYFSQLKNKHITVVFVSHDMTAVREYCDRAMLIEGGKIAAIGDTDMVAEKYLQLFVRDTAAKSKVNETRWGDQAAHFTDIKTAVTTTSVSISTKLISEQGLQGASVGFRLRDAAGTEITGTNTRLENQPAFPLRANKSVQVSWQFPNVLRDGTYSVDLAILYDNELTVADWWNGADNFVVSKTRHIPYVLDPGFTTTIYSQ